MKKLLFLFLIVASSATYAQKNAKAIHPKVKEYSLIVDDYLKFKKSGKNEMYKDLTKMSNLADEINCLLTLDQAKKAMPFYVENNLRARSCSSPEYPTTAELNDASFKAYKALIDKMMKQ